MQMEGLLRLCNLWRFSLNFNLFCYFSVVIRESMSLLWIYYFLAWSIIEEADKWQSLETAMNKHKFFCSTFGVLERKGNRTLFLNRFSPYSSLCAKMREKIFVFAVTISARESVMSECSRYMIFIMNFLLKTNICKIKTRLMWLAVKYWHDVS